MQCLDRLLGRTSPERDATIRWNKIHVEGRPTWFGTGGHGPPVLFLHGWGLGSRSYRKLLGLLADSGRRVYAPAMPGFGGTSALGSDDYEFDRYAAWVDAFLDEVSVDEPCLVIGHSFGGGVATRLAHDHPHRVSYLVLVNAVGGGQWASGTRVVDIEGRPLLDWAVHFGLEFVPVVQGAEMVLAMVEDIRRNIRRDPVAIFRAAQLARRADLTNELTELKRRGTPVLPITTLQDGVIPQSAFDALCDAVGVEGTVLPGRHAWLLADPRAFTAVLENVLEVDLAGVTGSPGHTVRQEMGRLLSATGMPADVAADLLADADPLWLMSAPPATLAADIALCHPAPGADEVRAVARSLTDGGLRLTVVAADRPGFLASTAGVLSAAGLSVRSASAVTWPTLGLAMHAVTIDPLPGGAEPDWNEIGLQLRALGAGERLRSAPPLDADYEVDVVASSLGQSLVTVTGPDRPGLLWTLASWFADHDLSIETTSIATVDGIASDTFLLTGDVDPGALRAFAGRDEPRRRDLRAV